QTLSWFLSGRSQGKAFFNPDRTDSMRNFPLSTVKKPLAIRSKTLIQASFWIAAVLVGLVGVVFDEWVRLIQGYYLRYATAHPVWVLALTPLLCLLAAGLVAGRAPYARGSGIPQ